MPHPASIVLLLLACATGPVQLTGQERANLPKSFHDDALNITYFYPAHFDPLQITRAQAQMPSQTSVPRQL